MNDLEKIVYSVIDQQKAKLLPSTFYVRKNYLMHLLKHGTYLSIQEPCQELFDSFVSRATTPDLRFQLFRAVRLVDKEAGTKALTPEGKLYNEPQIPSASDTERYFSALSFPIPDDEIDIAYMIRRAAIEMHYLNLSASTNGQYMQA